VRDTVFKYYLHPLTLEDLVIKPYKPLKTMTETQMFLEEKADEIIIKLNLSGKKKALLWYEGADHPLILRKEMINNIKIQGYSIDMNNSESNLSVPVEVQIADMALTPTIINLLQEMVIFPERKHGLVRVADQRQVAMVSTFTPHLTNYTPKLAVQKSRYDYWLPQYLDEFLKVSKQELTPNSKASKLEFAYHVSEDLNGPEGRFVGSFKLIKDELDNYYHFVTSLETPQ
jgi:hypothetical protein